MKRTLTLLVAAPLLVLALFVSSAQAEFGLNHFDVTFTEADGSPAAQAGSHPFAMTTSFNLNTLEEGTQLFPDQSPRDVFVDFPPGFVPNLTAIPRCSGAEFAQIEILFTGLPACSDSTAVGLASIDIALFVGQKPSYYTVPFYNLVPAPGAALKFGFVIEDVPVTIEAGLGESSPYFGVVRSTNISQAVSFFGAHITVWGTPADSAHDAERGSCVDARAIAEVPGEVHSKGNCSVSVAAKPFLTLPPVCHGPLRTTYAADSWQHPGARLPNGEPNLSDPNWASGEAETHDSSDPPNPLGTFGCTKLAFSPTITAQPTTKATTSPTGLDFSLDVADEGLTSPTGLAGADIKKAVVTLPEGFSTNPSIAEGLNVCTERDLEAETAFSAPGAGCPNASKIGSVEVETPLLEENVNGSLFIAKPYENEFHSLLALYIVIKNPKLGIVVRQALKVDPNPVTGQLTTVAENLPQLPFSHFRLHFREGARSPLVTPSACGAYDGAETAPGVHNPEPVKAVLTPGSGSASITTTSAFQIITGPDAGPCPTGGVPPFHPGLIAGTLNNAAGHYSPFNVRLFRSDAEQEITHFSIKLPPGIVGKLAGIPFCPDVAIAAATARTGPHGGQEELEAPSCPAASQVGRSLAGSGVGPSPAYAPGKVYLAGPYHGSNLSLASITAAKVGPFDLGTVVVRFALRINPETAEVFVDATGSDPIPHIIKGIPVHLRDIRAYVDKPNFVLNPTSCARTSTASTVLGSGLNFGSEADDQPITVSSPFQAADCANLGYKPKLSLKLKGSTKRGGTPALTAILKPRPGDANSKRISVALPHSEFLDQGHIRTVCTRVQFKAGAGNGAECPAGSAYGHAKAWTPLLSEPLEGPIFLRSSEHPLPDLVLALHGLIDFDAVGRIDSVHGGIRNTFETVPDAPITKVEVSFQGGDKGLLENSTSLCVGKHRATAEFTAQNGKQYNAKAPLQAQCKKKGHKKHAKKHRAHRLSRALRAAW